MRICTFYDSFMIPAKHTCTSMGGGVLPEGERSRRAKNALAKARERERERENATSCWTGSD